MNEFIFGSLSSERGRVEHYRERRSGLWHDHRIEPLAPRAGDTPRLQVTVGLNTAVDRLDCLLLEPQQLTIPLAPAKNEWDVINWNYVQTWEAALPAQPDGVVVCYRIKALLRDGRPPILADDGATFSYLVGEPDPPEWTSGAVIYQIFPDRFAPGAQNAWIQTEDLESACGETIKGISRKLDYIADLGFNCLWLNPFFPDRTYHGYHATYYFSVNPRLGDEDDVRQLVGQAHARGIRVLLDFVANHWGSRHPTFEQAVRDANSDYYHWYRWKQWPHDYETFFGVRDLPQINVDHGPARQHLLAAVRHWLTEFALDGCRLDYALGPSQDFWTDFRAEVNRVNPQAWIFGEVVETPQKQLSYWGRLHGCLDFVLQQALRSTFASETMKMAEFDALLEKHEAFFPAAYIRPSFLDNHDVNRFLWLAHGDTRKLKLAALCQFTLSGPPIVYDGTEAGLSPDRVMMQPDGGHQMAVARLPMIWGDAPDVELLAYYRWLIHFRSLYPALWRGRRRTVHLDASGGTYANIRATDDEMVTVCLNLSNERRAVVAAGHAFELAPWSGDYRVDSAGPSL
jgi:glycosidase